jgi:large subunit ribosomal protein L32e
MANFQRTKYYAFPKLGARQKSKRKYRRATGRHNKTRQKWRSKPPMVEIGYKNQCTTRGLINEKTPILVFNIKDLKNVKKDNIVIVGKVGDKNKYEIAKKCLAEKIEVQNLNLRKFIKQVERKFKKSDKEDKTKEQKNKPEVKK